MVKNDSSAKVVSTFKSYRLVGKDKRGNDIYYKGDRGYFSDQLTEMWSRHDRLAFEAPTIKELMSDLYMIKKSSYSLGITDLTVILDVNTVSRRSHVRKKIKSCKSAPKIGC